MSKSTCGVSLADRTNSREILESGKLEDVKVVLEKKILFWFEHAKRLLVLYNLTRQGQITLRENDRDEFNNLPSLITR